MKKAAKPAKTKAPKRPRLKPISLHPMSLDDVLTAALKIPPPPDAKRS